MIFYAIGMAILTQKVIFSVLLFISILLYTLINLLVYFKTDEIVVNIQIFSLITIKIFIH
jgi:hypothetical protein